MAFRKSRLREEVQLSRKCKHDRFALTTGCRNMRYLLSASTGLLHEDPHQSGLGPCVCPFRITRSLTTRRCLIR